MSTTKTAGLKLHYTMDAVQVGVSSVDFLALRCTACNADFHIDLSPAYCPQCGAELRGVTTFGEQP